jgi:hypothetical protein
MSKWNTTQTTNGPNDGFRFLEMTKPDSELTIVAKELPNGATLAFRKDANLPGGFEEIHSESMRSFDVAKSEAERFAAMYDREGTILIEGSPLLI